ncbi:MAG: beta-L-arabinofuranosidase domain-containing protein [Armatimonadota bacterium]|nr:glycoside hydrolase family 127 protein [bacterium]
MSDDRRGGNSPLPFNKVKIEDNFWGPRIRTNAKQTIPTQFKQLEDTGRLAAFKLEWKPGMEPVPHIFWDSDVAKWIEAAAYTISVQSDASIEAMMNKTVDLLVSSQQPDGYINSHYTVVEPENRWTNLRDCHELYCAGHLMEAAVAHYRATGKRTLLDAMCKYADYIDSVFGVEPGKKRGYCGHEEIELALVKLYEVTGNDRYLKLSEYFIEERGYLPHYFDQEAIARGEKADEYWAKTYAYCQADVPVREQTTIAGHAVRAMYFYSGAADLAGINNDSGLFSVLESLLDNLTTKRMYLTGGIGPSASNEGFTTDFDLPNETAYAETCAAIGLILWSHRMLRFDLDSHYADVMERALYNGSLSGISLDGTRYFYENPLASSGSHHRQKWFDCACCPPNITRMIASLGSYVYFYNDTDAIVNLYVQGEGQLEIGGRHITLKQETNYPWDGNVAITVQVDQSSTFALKLRIPGWSDGVEVSLNGEPLEAADVEKGYLKINREWRNGDKVELNFPMLVKRIYANPNVKQDSGMVAMQRGPIVYCLEGVDNSIQPHKILLPDDAEFEAVFEPDLLGGVVTIIADALCLDDQGWDGVLYNDTPPAARQCTIKAIPYYAWDNREPGWMSVWLRNG